MKTDKLIRYAGSLGLPCSNVGESLYYLLNVKGFRKVELAKTLGTSESCIRNWEKEFQNRITDAKLNYKAKNAGYDGIEDFFEKTRNNLTIQEQAVLLDVTPSVISGFLHSLKGTCDAQE